MAHGQAVTPDSMARWSRVHDTARKDGVDLGLRAFYAEYGLTGPAYGVSGYALVPADLVGESADRVVPVPAALEGLNTIAVRAGDADRAVPPSGWETGLAWLRLGLSIRLLDMVVRHLDGRAVGDASLLQQQMVKGALADVTIEHIEIQTMLTAVENEDTAVVADQHEGITRAGRMLLRLLGAAGFVADGPGLLAHASELLADAYVGSAVRER